MDKVACFDRLQHRRRTAQPIVEYASTHCLSTKLVRVQWWRLVGVRIDRVNTSAVCRRLQTRAGKIVAESILGGVYHIYTHATQTDDSFALMTCAGVIQLHGESEVRDVETLQTHISEALEFEPQTPAVNHPSTAWVAKELRVARAADIVL